MTGPSGVLSNPQNWTAAIVIISNIHFYFKYLEIHNSAICMAEFYYLKYLSNLQKIKFVKECTIPANFSSALFTFLVWIGLL